MKIPKQEILDLIQHFPDAVSIEQVMESLFVKQKIMRGLEQLDKGESYSHDQVKKMIDEWNRSMVA